MCVCMCVCVCVLSHVQLFATLWTVAHQAPLSMDSLGKNTGVGCHFLLQGIFLNQDLNPCLLCLLHWQGEALLLHHPSEIYIYIYIYIKCTYVYIRVEGGLLEGRWQ